MKWTAILTTATWSIHFRPLRPTIVANSIWAGRRRSDETSSKKTDKPQLLLALRWCAFSLSLSLPCSLSVQLPCIISARLMVEWRCSCHVGRLVTSMHVQLTTPTHQRTDLHHCASVSGECSCSVVYWNLVLFRPVCKADAASGPATVCPLVWSPGCGGFSVSK